MLCRRSSVKFGPTWQATQLPLPRKICNPACSSSDSAERSPLMKRSNAELPERIDRTKLASAREISSVVSSIHLDSLSERITFRGKKVEETGINSLFPRRPLTQAYDSQDFIDGFADR